MRRTSNCSATRIVSMSNLRKLTACAVALTRGDILRCGYDDERSGTNDDADGCRGGAGDSGAGGCRILVGFLVSGGAEHGDSRAEAGDGDALGSAAGAGQDLRGESVCDAGFLSASRDSAVVREARWESCGVLLSRMAVRCLLGAMCGDSVAFEPGQAEGGADFCGALSVRGAGRLRLGLYEFWRPQSGRQRAGNEIGGDDSGGAWACGFQRQIQSHAPFVRAAFAHRSWDYRIDGPGAWAVCAPMVVLAEAGDHSRESQAIRADSERIPDEPAFAEHEQRAVPVAEKHYRRAVDDDDRFCAAECPH